MSANINNEELLNRLTKIEGQIKGIAKMVKSDRFCTDILVQISAAENALNRVGQIILQNHITSCVVAGISSGNREETIKDLEKIISKVRI